VTAAIVDVKFRFKVIRHVMSNSVSKMPIFWGFVWFSVGERFAHFWGALLNYTQTG